MSAFMKALVARVSPPSLIDVLSVPTVAAAVLGCLRSKSALRQTCSALCALVDQHVEDLKLVCRGQEDVVIAGQLARKALKPRHITIVGSNTDSSSAAVAALLAIEQHHPMFQRVQSLMFQGNLPNNLPQDVFVSMPFLTHLTIEFNLGKQSAQMLAAVRLDTLRSLDARMDLCHAWFLQGCTQLKGLTLYTPNVKGVTAIAQLNGLTYLELDSAPRSQLLSAAEQSELGSTLAALTNLQSLRIDHAPPGPVTQALSQLTSLTELTLYQQSLVPNPGPLTLPSCVKLTFCISISMRHLASIQAPKLQHLAGASLALTPSNLDSLRRLCRGVLRACSRLTLYLHHAWSKEDTVALMAVLSQDWQPSAEALQAVTSNSTGLNRDTSGLERKSSNGPPEQQRLELVYAHCSRQCLQLLPEGMGSVYLWHCTLGPGSLEPLAQLASLGELHLYYCPGVTAASLERLFSTSVQGCLLKVTVCYCPDLPPLDTCTQMRQRVVAQRGSRDTPMLAYQ